MFPKYFQKRLEDNRLLIPKMSVVGDEDTMALSEHIEEFSQRLVFCLIFISLAIILCFIDIKGIVLRFFLSYGAEVIEPFWSFDQYFDFVAVLLFATGLSFQVPAIQVVLGLLNIVSGKKMLSAWKYVIVICTVIAAIITPSTDPITQILLSTALLSLYLGGSSLVILLKKEGSLN
jgi:sec-independent protein translocase protein TatC